MNYQGIVTKHNLDYCTFILDDKISVFAGYLYAHCPKIIVPILNETIIIQNAEMYIENLLLLNPNSKIFCNETCSNDQIRICEAFLELIKKHNISFLEVLEILQTNETFEKTFTKNFLKKYVSNLTYSIKTLIIHTVSHLYAQNRKNKLIKLNISSPSCHKLVEDGETIKSSIYWNFGVNFSKTNECLVGFLHVSTTLGFIVLSDAKYFFVLSISCDNTPEYSQKMLDILNKFVIIKNFVVFSENIQSFGIFHYLHVNFKDIHEIKPDNNHLTTNSDLSNFLIKVRLKIIHRATVTIKNDKFQCWIHCAIQRSENEPFRNCMIRLYGKKFAIYPIFNPDDEYYLTTNSTLFRDQMQKFIGEKRYTIHGESLQVFPIPTDAILEVIPRNTSYAAAVISNDFTLLTIPEAEEVLKTKQKDKKKLELVSFEGIIVEKRFLDSFTSLSNPVKNRAFGTPGKLVHQLVLSAPFEEKCLTREQNCQLNQERIQLKLYKKKSDGKTDSSSR